jgi:hypothetical protein
MAGTLTEKNKAWLRSNESPAEKSKAKPARKSAAARLDQFLAEAQAGASDDYLIRASGASQADVRSWKKRHKIGRPKRDTVEQMNALDLGDQYQPHLHTTHDGVAGGKWEIPQYVLREPIDYSSLCRLVFDLKSNGEDTETLAAALGLRPTDIELAAEVWERHLIGPNGRTCTKCKRHYDMRFGSVDHCRTCLSRWSPG